MGLLDRLFGRNRPAAYPSSGASRSSARYHTFDQRRRDGTDAESQRTKSPDEIAVERYRYLLRTAPPETIEQAHAEAFAQLNVEQRQQVLKELGQNLPPGERSAGDDPQSLARMATRAELRRPGFLERSFGGYGGYGGRGGYGGAGMGGIGMGGLFAGGLLTSIAGAFVGTAIAESMFDMFDDDDTGHFDNFADDNERYPDDGYRGDDVQSAGDFGGSDFGGSDFGGGDFGGGNF